MVSWLGVVPGPWSWGCVVSAFFCLVSSRSFVAPRPGRPPLAAPWWRSLVGSALAAGALRWRLRASPRSFSGAVVVVGFGSPAAAASFASAWSGWVGFAVAVRRFAGAAGPVWGVSVPVSAPPVLPSVAAPVPPLPPRLGWVRGA